MSDIAAAPVAVRMATQAPGRLPFRRVSIDRESLDSTTVPTYTTSAASCGGLSGSTSQTAFAVLHERQMRASAANHNIADQIHFSCTR